MHNNQAHGGDPFCAHSVEKIEFECLGELEDDLEWKVTYVGSAEDQTRDQILEEVMVGPVPMGLSKFVLTADAADTQSIPMTDLVGVTVVFITCSYREKEFVRIGYYVNNEIYSGALPHAAAPPTGTAATATDAAAATVAPQQPMGDVELQEFLVAGGIIDVSKVFRSIMHKKPRVTRFQIDWTPQSVQQEQEQEQVQMQMQTTQQQHLMMHQQMQGQKPLFSGGLPALPLHSSCVQTAPPQIEPLQPPMDF